MKYIELQYYFWKKWFFHINDVRLIEPDFLKWNLHRRVKSWYLKRISSWWYAFSSMNISSEVFATIWCTIYQPSYVSMELVFRYYNLIPEWVFAHTAITTKKTQKLSGDLGVFLYRSVKPELYWWYKIINHSAWWYYYMAELEKAFCDFFYLRHDYNTLSDFASLRLDMWELNTILCVTKLRQYAEWFNNKRLLKTINLFIVYCATYDQP